MRAGAKGIRGNAIQELFWTRTSLLLTTLIVVSAASMALSATLSEGMLKSVLTALGTGTMVTAVVGFGQTLITAKAQHRAMVAPLIEENRRALKELSAEYRSLNREFFPTHVFEATNDPDPTFNHLLMQDLHATRQYFFRGFSGRHAAVRLLTSREEWELRAVVADPSERSAISGRARYLIRHHGVGADLDDIQDQLHDEICLGLVGLFLARTRCSRMDITVISDPPLDRVEMFDGSVWITLYSEGGATTLYPRTLRFSEGSFIYAMERAEFMRISGSREGRHLRITPETTRRDFLTEYGKATGSKLSEEQFRKLEAKFHDFRREFSAIAELES